MSDEDPEAQPSAESQPRLDTHGTPRPFRKPLPTSEKKARWRQGRRMPKFRGKEARQVCADNHGRIVEWLDRGWSYRSVARHLDMTGSAIKEYCKKHGLNSGVPLDFLSESAAAEEPTRQDQGEG